MGLRWDFSHRRDAEVTEETDEGKEVINETHFQKVGVTPPRPFPIRSDTERTAADRVTT